MEDLTKAQQTAFLLQADIQGAYTEAVNTGRISLALALEPLLSEAVALERKLARVQNALEADDPSLVKI